MCPRCFGRLQGEVDRQFAGMSTREKAGAEGSDVLRGASLLLQCRCPHEEAGAGDVVVEMIGEDDDAA